MNQSSSSRQSLCIWLWPGDMFELNGASRSDLPPGFLSLSIWIEVGRHGRHPMIMFPCVFHRCVSFGMLRCGYGRWHRRCLRRRFCAPWLGVCCTCMNSRDKQAEKQTLRNAHTHLHTHSLCVETTKTKYHPLLSWQVLKENPAEKLLRSEFPWRCRNTVRFVVYHTPAQRFLLLSLCSAGLLKHH